MKIKIKLEDIKIQFQKAFKIICYDIIINFLKLYIYTCNIEVTDLWRQICEGIINPLLEMKRNRKEEFDDENYLFLTYNLKIQPEMEMDPSIEDKITSKNVTKICINSHITGYNIKRYSRNVLVFTDIADSTSIWNYFAEDMEKALAIHDNCVFELVKKYNGNAITNEGDAFLIAFENVINAISFSFDLQDALQKTKWPEKIISHSLLNKKSFDNLGLKVRIVITYGYLDKLITPQGAYYKGNHVERIKELSSEIKNFDIYICGCVEKSINISNDRIGSIYDYIYQYYYDTEISYKINIGCNFHYSKM
ncbi:Adenylate cyclase [Astathelohania contejeani]|uniref:Adenylate cyclase n=1 Tax=Astathelohania contejeani TaxID=164912 RepID=A0ABQ7I2S4_9MICR|nr:Adenylate cyclase [Thelohania contejeani]